MKGWQILSAIFSMVFHIVHWQSPPHPNPLCAIYMLDHMVKKIDILLGKQMFIIFF